MINFHAEYADGPAVGGVPLLRPLDGLAPDLPPSITAEAHPPSR